MNLGPLPEPTPRSDRNSSDRKLSREHLEVARDKLKAELDERGIPVSIGLGYGEDGRRVLSVQIHPDIYEIPEEQIAELRAMREFNEVPLEVSIIEDLKGEQS